MRSVLHTAKLYVNAAQCLKCNETIYSREEKEFVVCRCGNVKISGGLEYLNRWAEDPMKFVELSEWEEE